MAIYHLSMKIISRKNGYSAVASAAYRSGSVIPDDRTGLIHDYTRKRGVDDAVILTLRMHRPGVVTVPFSGMRSRKPNSAGTPSWQGRLNSPFPVRFPARPHGRPFSLLSGKTLSVGA